MATDIKKIPSGELWRDLVETIGDIKICQDAIRIGVLTYGNGESAQERLEINLEIKNAIESELERRKEGQA